MTIKNKLYNYFHKVKRVRSRGAVNVGVFDNKICKYDWSKPIFKYVTKPINMVTKNKL